MRPSRGMGDIKRSKMPGKKTIRRKDNPDEVAVYAKGGRARKPRAPKVPKSKQPPKKPTRPRLGPPLRDYKPRRWPKELD